MNFSQVTGSHRQGRTGYPTTNFEVLEFRVVMLPPLQLALALPQKPPTATATAMATGSDVALQLAVDPYL